MDFETLIQDYLDGELTDGQFTELSGWLERSEANREVFVRAVNMDTDIHRKLSNADLHAFLEEVDIHALQDVIEQSHADQSAVLLSISGCTEPEIDKPDVTVRKAAAVLSHAGGEIAGRILRQHAKAISIAALVAIAAIIGTIFLISPDAAEPAEIVYTPSNTPAVTLAYVSDTYDAKWSGESFELRDGIPQGSYKLAEGSIQIEMVSGANTLIHAPAHFTLQGSNQIALHAGTLDAQVPRRAIGFTVETPDARIVDIGTEFSVKIDELANDTQIAVHVGEVLASASASLDEVEPTSLTAGQAVSVGTDAQLRQATYVPNRFEDAIAARRYEPGVTGGPAVFQTILPDDLRMGKQVSGKLQVFLEQSGLMLDNEIAVDLQGDDQWPSQELRLINAGQRVDVYLVHMDRTGIEADDLPRTLDFGRPILGVAARHQNLMVTDRLVDPQGTRRFDNQPDDKGELLRGIESGDKARLLPGGTSLQLQMLVAHKSDQVRVFVQALDTTDE